MRVIHYYQHKRYKSNEFQRTTDFRYFCNDEFVTHNDDDPMRPRTAYRQVTCPECLSDLIKKQETILEEMRLNLKITSTPVNP